MKRNKKSFIRYMRKTYKNKIIASIIFILGCITLRFSNDGTFMLFTTFLSVPLFFEKDNQIYY